MPLEYANDAPFVVNSTFKPITSYRFNKFKNMHRMRGLDFPDKSAAN